MVQPSSGGRPKDVKNAEREVQLDQFIWLEDQYSQLKEFMVGLDQ